MVFNKKNLIALIQGKGDCCNVLCGNSSCDRCQLNNKSYPVCYKIAIEKFIKKYGEDKLFEVLL